MLNFMLKDDYTIIYKESLEIKVLKDDSGMLSIVTPKNIDEININIKEYFMKNTFARLLANLSSKDVSIANLITMYQFLTTVKKDYYILKEQFNNLSNKEYKALLAVRQKDSVKEDKEHMKLIWFTGELNSMEEAKAIMEENYPSWCKDFNFTAIPLNSHKEFLEVIKK